ncbi:MULTISPECIES: pirin family protein [Cryobacterium]|uniref:pirin family protein n=1 Tax=Cryobacterium TaxID=69578 RepID=UPI000CD3EECC|nr:MULTISPECIES: pirin family protein [Cryobacterium]POH66755.1 pirin [Cryobacterium zongtaii]TFC42446.1 pirin family protein [Cryobacterium sp. TMN-39-2]TFC60253.1 pirin family protein [Cryobacterium sp. TMB1-7]
MSNLETEPVELVCDPSTTTEVDIVILQPRDVPLGGLRAMGVRRTLPQRARSLIGAWCFVDHYGPDDVSVTGGMVVPPHPHTGLQTASWLFAGEVEHRDSVGSLALVRPGELNLMTAGSGISHSEVSTPDTTALHGVQLWIALPELTRHQAPHFENHVITPVTRGAVTLHVFLGTLAGQTAAAAGDTPLVGAQIDLPAGSSIDLDVDRSFEHGVLVDVGTVSVGGAPVHRNELGFIDSGRPVIRLENTGDSPTRVLLLGGEPLGEQIVMWWNFIGRSHEEITAWRDRWQAEVIDGSDAAGRFGHVAYHGAPLPAPMLPTVRLKPRR